MISVKTKIFDQNSVSPTSGNVSCRYTCTCTKGYMDQLFAAAVCMMVRVFLTSSVSVDKNTLDGILNILYVLIWSDLWDIFLYGKSKLQNMYKICCLLYKKWRKRRICISICLYIHKDIGKRHKKVLTDKEH